MSFQTMGNDDSQEAISASATTYYVDADNGDDLAAGTSPSTAWRSIDRVNRQAFQPGDTVLFRRGGIFRGGTLQLQSGAPGSPVTYSAYGDGPKPAIQPSFDFHVPEKWEEIEDGLWRTKKTATYTIKENGEAVDLRLSSWSMYVESPAVVTSTSTLNEGGNIYTFTCVAAGARDTQVQLFGPALANGNSHYVITYRIRSSIPFEMSAFRIMHSRGAMATYSLEYGKGVQVSQDWQEVDCFLYNDSYCPPGTPIALNNFMGLALPEGAVVDFEPLWLREADFLGTEPLVRDIGNVIFNHGEFIGWKRWSVDQLKNERDYYHDSREGILFMRHTGNPGGAYSSLEFAPRLNCVSHETTHDAVVDGLWCRYSGAHGFGGGNLGHTCRVVIRNCDVCYIGGSVLWPHNNTRYGNGIEFWCEAQDCLVEHNHIWQCYDVAITNQGLAPYQAQRNLIYRNNLLHNCEHHYEYWRFPASAITENIQFVHNTCVNAGQGWSHCQRPDKHSCHLLAYVVHAQTRHIIIKDNIFCNGVDNLIWHHSDIRKTLDIDYNLWWQDDSEQRFIHILDANYTLKFSDFRKWQTDDGKDPHSTIGKPVFVNPDYEHPEWDGFRLVPDSPGTHAASDGGPVGFRL